MPGAPAALRRAGAAFCARPQYAAMDSGAPAEPVSAVQVAVIVLLVALLVYFVAGAGGAGPAARENFASRRAREIHAAAQEVFAGGGDAPYSTYKERVPGADPVQYTDVRALFLAGRLSPQAVEAVM